MAHRVESAGRALLTVPTGWVFSTVYFDAADNDLDLKEWSLPKAVNGIESWAEATIDSEPQQAKIRQNSAMMRLSGVEPEAHARNHRSRSFFYRINASLGMAAPESDPHFLAEVCGMGAGGGSRWWEELLPQKNISFSAEMATSPALGTT
ncbi:hypothetical protein CH63R_13017 [Colletotrichum higginsianum IMI 349063]|uniref:Uncharacterized protein n=1 Tax=Colletotrichum higginsianum (strain IMI 349063) TaxID=759273 RepID=A0A1B7XVX4_COLHI|nr:hypothetical protein CH63R_13017 [Colletotrichum higginsianum IMI 349063]OBR03890.1 hypothetical protein CH63R_13017 [Colletotrichum higginsianum IMI 349063]